MSYENAPATKMLATHCAVCSRPLLDSISVECGIGPVCRERHGWDAEVQALGEGAREAANVIVCHIAQAGTDEASRAAGCAALRLLGFKKLPERIEFRGKDAPAAGTVHVRLSSKLTGYYVKAPYKPAAVEAWRSIRGRKWDGDAEENFVPTGSRAALWHLLRTHYAGLELTTDHGFSGPIPEPEGRDEAVAAYVAEVRTERASAKAQFRLSQFGLDR